jgi:hypothetical protein
LGDCAQQQKMPRNNFTVNSNIAVMPAAYRYEIDQQALSCLGLDSMCIVHSKNWIETEAEGIDQLGRPTPFKGVFFAFYLQFNIKHCFICRPSGSTV